MYAVVLIKGKQYKVEEGQEITVDRINSKEGSTLNFDKVLTISSDGKSRFGDEASGATVKANILEHFRGEKITVLKYKAKERYRRTLGHKQHLTRLKITGIDMPGVKKEKKAPEKKTAGKSQEPKGKSQETKAKKTATTKKPESKK